MAFSNIENSEKLDIIQIAIIDNEKELKNNEILKKSFEELSNESNEERMLNTQYVTEEKAKELLENDEIVGYLKVEDEEPNIIVKESGINETIFKYIVEEINATSSNRRRYSQK